MNLKKMLTTAVLIVAGCSMTALAQVPAKPEFQLCKGIFALCTFSQCEPIMILGTPLLFSCGCRVHRDE